MSLSIQNGLPSPCWLSAAWPLRPFQCYLLLNLHRNPIQQSNWPSPCANTPAAFVLHLECATRFNWNVSFHCSAFQFVYPSNLNIKTKHRTTDPYTHIPFTSSLTPSMVVSGKWSLSKLNIRCTHPSGLFYLQPFWTLVLGPFSSSMASHCGKRARNGV